MLKVTLIYADFVAKGQNSFKLTYHTQAENEKDRGDKAGNGENNDENARHKEHWNHKISQKLVKINFRN